MPRKPNCFARWAGLVRGLSILFWGLALTGLVCLEMVYLETAQMIWRESFGRAGFCSGLAARPAALARPEPTARFSAAGTDLAARLEPGGDARGARCRPGAVFILVAQISRRSALRRLRGLLFLSSLFLLVQINCVLQRLCAMLPDETLRAETKLFTALQHLPAPGVFGRPLPLFPLDSLPRPVPPGLDRWMDAAAAAGIWLALFLILMPLAMTMALLWKIKEVIFSSLTKAGRRRAYLNI